MPRVSEKYKAEKRELILDAAAQCFAEKGYNETKVDDIASASRTSKGSIYLYFKSKEEIFYRLNERRTKKYFEVHEKIDQIDTATEKIQSLFKYFTSGSIKKDDYNQIAVQFEFWIYISKGDNQTIFDERAARFTNFMKKIIYEGVQSGEFRKGIDVESFSRLFWSLLDGIVLHLLFHKSEDQQRSMLRIYEQMILRYLQP